MKKAYYSSDSTKIRTCVLLMDVHSIQGNKLKGLRKKGRPAAKMVIRSKALMYGEKLNVLKLLISGGDKMRDLIYRAMNGFE